MHLSCLRRNRSKGCKSTYRVKLAKARHTPKQEPNRCTVNCNQQPALQVSPGSRVRVLEGDVRVHRSHNHAAQLLAAKGNAGVSPLCPLSPRTHIHTHTRTCAPELY
jgi:hypothetical protein